MQQIEDVAAALLEKFSRDAADHLERKVPTAALEDELLRSFRHLVTEKHLQRALALVEKGQVVQFVAQPSGRRMYQVEGTSGAHYLSFPGHFCSCKAFLFDVLGRGDQIYCKHQLACLLACALRMERVHPVSDVAMAHLAEHAGEVGPLL